jgi:hypothetical protein
MKGILENIEKQVNGIKALNVKQSLEKKYWIRRNHQQQIDI